MERDDKQRKRVGVYERPASADRKRTPWILVVLMILVAVAWIAYFAFSRG